MYVMKRYTSSQVRERLSDVLDAAERGEEVVIERRGARFLLRVEGSDRPAARRRGRPAIEILDPAVAEGEWTWAWKPTGLAFTKRPRR
jgi:antitoxin (DNA-binding transcriptional repressor) of toxin-antitoxin stability system